MNTVDPGYIKHEGDKKKFDTSKNSKYKICISKAQTKAFQASIIVSRADTTIGSEHNEEQGVNYKSLHPISHENSP